MITWGDQKLNRFSLIIPSTEEMADILCRIRKMNYPIKEALEDHGRMGILLVDPEENELEIYHEENKNDQREIPETMDQEALLRKSEENSVNYQQVLILKNPFKCY